MYMEDCITSNYTLVLYKINTYIKTNILDNYEYGIKLIYKVNKYFNNNSHMDHSLNLHSEVGKLDKNHLNKI